MDRQKKGGKQKIITIRQTNKQTEKWTVGKKGEKKNNKKQ